MNFKLYQGCHRVVYILGPLAFIPYISIICPVIFLGLSDEGNCCVLQEELSMWSHSWHLSFKVCCCAVFIVLFFSFLQTHILIINDHPVVTQESYQDLGIIISEDFSRELHYELITSRAYKTLGLMWRTLLGHNALVLSDLVTNG